MLCQVCHGSEASSISGQPVVRFVLPAKALMRREAPRTAILGGLLIIGFKMIILRRVR